MARKILLADDSVTAQNMGRKILADAGYDVITVNNGSAALKRISDISPDLIVLDVYMPGYSGLEVCQRLKESADTAHIPVLLTVGKLEPFKPEEARRVRADAHIVKPFEASELLTAISKLEDRMVPQSPDSSRVSATTSGVERFGEAGAKKSSAKVAETDTGWKNRIRFPSKKKKEEEPDAEEIAAAELATLADSRKGKKAAGNGVFAKTPAPQAAVVPDIPRDITPEELDALSALAEKLDSPAVAEKAAPETKKFQRRSTDIQSPQPPVAQASVLATAVEESKEKFAVEAAFVDQQRPEANPVTEVRGEEKAVAPESQEAEAPAAAQVADVQSAAVETVAPEQTVGEATQPKLEQATESVEQSQGEVVVVSSAGSQNLNSTSTDAVGAQQIEAPPIPLDAEPSGAEGNGNTTLEQPAEEASSSVWSEPFQVVTPSAISHESVSIDGGADAATENHPATNVGTQPEGPAPSDAELAAALQLLTPATSGAESQPSNGHYSEAGAQAIAAGTRWIAEAVSLSAEESTICLESEMFGVPTDRMKDETGGATKSAQAANAVAIAELDRSYGFSGIAAAVETRLAEAGMGGSSRTWTSERERSAESAAAEAAAALEASAQLLAAASAANPLIDQIGANVEQKIAAVPESQFAQHQGEPHESRPSESSATFADAVNADSQTYPEVDASAGASTGDSDRGVVENHSQTLQDGSSATGAEDQNSMSKDKDKKTQSGKSNWHEINSASVPSAESDLENSKHNAAGEDSQKAMAAAASEGANSSTDANTIASIVDSVMADLRPRIVEEIARKLSKK